MASNGNQKGACVFVYDREKAAIPTTTGQDGILTLVKLDGQVVGNPQLIQCSEADETWYLETTASELNKLIGQRCWVL